jgi:hypothetical protein
MNHNNPQLDHKQALQFWFLITLIYTMLVTTVGLNFYFQMAEPTQIWAYDVAYITVVSMLGAVQLGVYISIVVLYLRLRRILSPSDRYPAEPQETFDRRQEVSHRFQDGYSAFNRNFLTVIAVLTVRMAVYSLEKASSHDRIELFAPVSGIAVGAECVSEVTLSLLLLCVVLGTKETVRETEMSSVDGDALRDDNFKLSH